MMNRRRFLAISAAATATPAMSAQTRWRGYAMGAEVSVTLDADTTAAVSAISSVQAILEHCEALFSLYRPESALSRLNRDGRLPNPEPDMLSLLEACDWAHNLTKGRFDPSVQPMWLAAATGQNADTARELIGWDRVQVSPDQIVLDRGQSLTLNGIAQGYATDLVTQALRQGGWSNILVNVGEYYAAGRNWSLGISDPENGIVKAVTLQDRAIATSSPGALRLSDCDFHILNPNAFHSPLWSTVSVEAETATQADALSTAFCFASRNEIVAMLSQSNEKISAFCVQEDGHVYTLSA